MPTKKKKAFTKKNSVKYVILHGHESALNADGQPLEHEWIPIDRSYKPGKSLIMGRLAELVGGPIPTEQPLSHANISAQLSKEPDLQAILDQFEDASVSEDGEILSMKNELQNLELKDDKNLKSDLIVEEYEEDEDEWEDDDASVDSNLDSSEEYDEKKRNGLQKKLKKKFEEYDEGQIGPLEDEEIFGYLTGESKHIDYYLGKKDREDAEIGKCEDALKEKILRYCEEDHAENLVEIVTEHKLEFDCESIISTYSNKYNHPTIIREEGKIRKIKIPNNPLQKQLTKSKLKQLESESESESCSDDDGASIASTINIRPKGETPEQRRERKKMFKQLKSENRIFKKENKIAFKKEKKFQEAQAINVKNNRGIRLF